MAQIPVSDFNNMLDDVLLGVYKAIGTSGSGYGIGDGSSAFGAFDAVDDALTHLEGVGDLTPIADMGRQLDSLKTAMSGVARFAREARSFVASIDRHVAKFGGSNYSNLDTFLTYYNVGAGGTWTALQDRKLRDLFNAIKGGSNYPSPENLYFEVLQGTLSDEDHLYTNGLGKLEVGVGFSAAIVEGSLVNGVVNGAIDHTKYSGGDNVLNVSTFGGSSDTVTVTGYAFDPATQTVDTGSIVTWDATVSGTGDVALAVNTAPANSRIIEVTNIAAGGSITSGIMYVEAQRPSGRPLLK